MGNNTFKLAYGENDGIARRTGAVGDIVDGELWSIGLDHKLSNRTTVYAAYADFESDNGGGTAEYDALSFGIIHKF
jgi:predicted porin